LYCVEVSSLRHSASVRCTRDLLISITTLEGSPQAERPSGEQEAVVLALVMAREVGELLAVRPAYKYQPPAAMAATPARGISKRRAEGKFIGVI